MASEKDLAKRLAALERRVRRLESPADAGSSNGNTADRFWALTGLRERLADSSGQVLFTGLTNLPSGEVYEWQQGASTDALLDLDWSQLSAPFAALGHPVRLELLRRVLHGHHAVGELQELVELSTTGQLYHHVKQLIAAGWLRAAGRGHYAVPGERVIPLLVFLSAFAPPSAKETGRKQECSTDGVF